MARTDEDFERIAAHLKDVPVMTRTQGRAVYDHLRRTGAKQVLDIGTCYGTSAAYMAAALEANGEGMVTTVDHDKTENPWVEELLERCGVQHRVDVVRTPHSSYAWFLKEQIEARSDRQGNCEPLYDFVYLDGAHSLTIDGLAVVLIERLLRPGGWLLLDDLDWSYDYNPSAMPVVEVGEIRFAPSDVERSQPHMRAVFDLVVRAHPSFGNLRIQDGTWGWAQKVGAANGPAPKRNMSIRLERWAGR